MRKRGITVGAVAAVVVGMLAVAGCEWLVGIGDTVEQPHADASVDVSGDLSVDVEAGDSGTCIPLDDANILPDPTFETDPTNYWRRYGTSFTWQTSAAHCGTHAIRVCFEDPSAPWWTFGTIRLFTNPAPGSHFAASAWVRLDSPSGGRVALFLRQAGANENWARTIATPSWQKMIVSPNLFIVGGPDGGPFGAIELYASLAPTDVGLTTQDCFDLDDVWVGVCDGSSYCGP